jgi:hypothetical protein
MVAAIVLMNRQQGLCPTIAEYRVDESVMTVKD